MARNILLWQFTLTPKLLLFSKITNELNMRILILLIFVCQSFYSMADDSSDGNKSVHSEDSDEQVYLPTKTVDMLKNERLVKRLCTTLSSLEKFKSRLDKLALNGEELGLEHMRYVFENQDRCYIISEVHPQKRGNILFSAINQGYDEVAKYMIGVLGPNVNRIRSNGISAREFVSRHYYRKSTGNTKIREAYLQMLDDATSSHGLQAIFYKNYGLVESQ